MLQYFPKNDSLNYNRNAKKSTLTAMPVTEKKNRFSGLNFQFIVYFLLFSYVPLLIFSGIGYFLNRDMIRQVNQANLVESANMHAKTLRDYIGTKKSLFLLLYQSNMPELLENEPSALNNFRSQITKTSAFDDVYLISGTQVIPVNNQSQLQMAPFTAPDSESVQLVLSDNLRSLLFNLKITDEVRAVLTFPAIELVQLLSDQQPQSQFELLNGNKTISVKDGRLSVSENSPDREGGIDPAAPIEEINNADDGRIKYRTPVIYGWELQVKRPAAIIYGELQSFLTEIVIANIFIGIIMFALALVLSSRITNPIRSLVLAAKKIRKGDLAEPIRVRSKDEIKLLADEFELMRKKLLESYTDLELKVEERTKALRDAQFQISHQEKMASLGLLAAGVAHEIGNPLTSISSMAQIIKRKVRDQQFIEYLNTILTNIDRISKIVRELVDFARPSSFESSYVNVNELIENAVGIVRYDRRAKHINLNLDLDKELPQLYLVADQLLQVFINMMINAVDALQNEDNQISIKSYCRDDLICIHFKDSGIGIPKENINKVFEPFFTTKKVGKGTGLGLSVSYGIIKNFNGNIGVESTPGKGSTFMIEIPVTKPEIIDES